MMTDSRQGVENVPEIPDRDISVKPPKRKLLAKLTGQAAEALFGRRTVSYVRSGRRERQYYGKPHGEIRESQWIVVDADDFPMPHREDVSDDVSASLLCNEVSSEALRNLRHSYHEQPIRDVDVSQARSG
jgi:hypothetical protein